MSQFPRPSIRILTDGKAGDEQPLIGIAEAIGVEPDIRRIAPRAFYASLMPWGPIDPKDRSTNPASPIAPPFPDICLATGRRAVAYLRALKKASPDTFTVFFKDPRTRYHGADLLVVQTHDAPRGQNILVTPTAPNRMSAARLSEARETAPDHLKHLPSPRSAVLIGGDSRHHRFSQEDIERLMHALDKRIHSGHRLMITTSRRTPKSLADALAAFSKEDAVALWDGTGQNPLPAYLALADEIIVTADSTNMIGEAAASGRPIQVFHPQGGHRKLDTFLSAISEVARVGIFPDAPASGNYPPVNATPLIAETIMDGWKRKVSSRNTT